jgi:hypothetical protein
MPLHAPHAHVRLSSQGSSSPANRVSGFGSLCQNNLCHSAYGVAPAEGSSALVLPRYAFYSNLKHYRSRSLVCDMPSSKRLEPLKAAQANMSQGAGALAAMQPLGQKRGPGHPGPVREERRRTVRTEARKAWKSEAETRQVSVADRDPCAGHQRAIDRREEAAEQARIVGQAERSSLGHWYSLPAGAVRRVLIWA